jgi:hypothetical protein
LRRKVGLLHACHNEVLQRLVLRCGRLDL